MVSKILYSTFIGLRVRIILSTQENLMGLEGKVVDETKNLLVISSDGKERKVPKVSCIFRFYTKDGHVDVDGKRITFRPHERPKKV